MNRKSIQLAALAIGLCTANVAHAADWKSGDFAMTNSKEAVIVNCYKVLHVTKEEPTVLVIIGQEGDPAFAVAAQMRKCSKEMIEARWPQGWERVEEQRDQKKR